MDGNKQSVIALKLMGEKGKFAILKTTIFKDELVHALFLVFSH